MRDYNVTFTLDGPDGVGAGPPHPMQAPDMRTLFTELSLLPRLFDTSEVVCIGVNISEALDPPGDGGVV